MFGFPVLCDLHISSLLFTNAISLNYCDLTLNRLIFYSAFNLVISGLSRKGFRSDKVGFVRDGPSQRYELYKQTSGWMQRLLFFSKGVILRAIESWMATSIWIVVSNSKAKLVAHDSGVFSFSKPWRTKSESWPQEKVLGKCKYKASLWSIRTEKFVIYSKRNKKRSKKEMAIGATDT